MILNRYKGLLAAAPFPFEFCVVATNEAAAKAKAKYQAKQMKLKTGRFIEINIDSRFEMKDPRDV